MRRLLDGPGSLWPNPRAHPEERLFRDGTTKLRSSVVCGQCSGSLRQHGRRISKRRDMKPSRQIMKHCRRRLSSKRRGNFCGSACGSRWTPTVAENVTPFYQADVVNSLPCRAGITEIRDVSPSAVDRLDPQAAGSRPSKHWGFRVDLPANHLGPGWRERAG